MNCSDFRRRLLIDPRAAEMAEAAQQRVCEDASTRLAEALVFENRIEAALAVPVPADLAERVLAAIPQTLPAAASTAPPRRHWPLALAASLAVLTLTALSLLRGPNPTNALIVASVEHLAHEPYALTRSNAVPTTLIDRMFTEAGLRLDSNALTLTYLNRCPFQSRWSVHMVMLAPQGPVTVMYVPDEKGIERMDTRRDMVAVRTLPFAQGAMVLLAESNKDFDRVESAWHHAAGDVVLAAGGR